VVWLRTRIRKHWKSSLQDAVALAHLREGHFTPG
jgi:hypothetical protein